MISKTTTNLRFSCPTYFLVQGLLADGGSPFGDDPAVFIKGQSMCSLLLLSVRCRVSLPV